MSQVEDQIEDSEKDIMKILKTEMELIKKQNQELIEEIKKIQDKKD